MTDNDHTNVGEFSIPPLLTSRTAALLLDAFSSGEKELVASLDLGLNDEHVKLSGDAAVVQGFPVTRKQLKKVSKRSNIVFAVDDQGLYPLEIREGGYAKLVPFEGGDGPPTLEFSGIKMHRTKGIDPFEDARTKVEAIVAPGDTTLDTCGGLGYTSIWARRFGAAEVVSCEINPNTIALRRYNPWSLDYLDDDSIEKLEGDIAVQIADFEDGYFDSIIHDPPRFSLAGELYGEGFIGHLARVLKHGGKLVFYTGEPYRVGRGRDFIAGVEKRLRKLRLSGEYDREIQAIVTTKN